MKYVLSLLVVTAPLLSFAQSTLDANKALFFLTPCLVEVAASVDPTYEHLSLESGEYSETSDFTITYAIFTSDMDGYRVNRRLLVHGSHDPKPKQDVSDLIYTCEIK